MQWKGHENDPTVFKTGETIFDTLHIRSWSVQMPSIS